MAMKHDELEALLDRLGLSRERAARLLSVERDELHRWTVGKKDVPAQAALILRLMAAKRISPTEAMAIKNPHAY